MLSVVLPCYNEDMNIADAVRDVHQWMRAEQVDGEIIVVDDGSKDKSLSVLQGLQAEVPMLKIVRHEKNGGYGIAVRSGCDAATKEWIAFMDSDGQFKAEDLSRLLPFRDRYAFITGRRRKRADSFIRNVYGKILAIMNWMVLGIFVRDVNCGMKMFRRSIWPDIRPVHGVEKLFNIEMFMHLKQHRIPWFTVDVPHYPRTKGSPTGSSVRVIIRMFWELWNLKKAQRAPVKAMQAA